MLRSNASRCDVSTYRTLRLEESKLLQRAGILHSQSIVEIVDRNRGGCNRLALQWMAMLQTLSSSWCMSAKTLCTLADASLSAYRWFRPLKMNTMELDHIP